MLLSRPELDLRAEQWPPGALRPWWSDSGMYAAKYAPDEFMAWDHGGVNCEVHTLPASSSLALTTAATMAAAPCRRGYTSQSGVPASLDHTCTLLMIELPTAAQQVQKSLARTTTPFKLPERNSHR